MKNKINFKKVKKILIVFILTLLVLLFVKTHFAKSTCVYNANKLDLYSEEIVRDMSADQAVTNLNDGRLPEEHSMWDLFITPISFISSAIGFLFRSIIYLVISGIMLIIDKLLGEIGGQVQKLTIESILFNKVPLLNPAFWLMPAKNAEGLYTSAAGIIKGVTVIAVALQLLVLVVIAIKGIIRTVSLKKYVTKKQLQTDIDKILMDWFMGIIILFGVVFYAAIMIGINNTFVNILSETFKIDGKDITTNLEEDIFAFNQMMGTVSLMLYAVLRIQAITLFILYLKRFVKLMFLIIISPLIATTYAVDRINDGKSQALSAWNKMFIQTVFMQTIHIVIYVSTVSMLINPGNDTFSLAGLVLSAIGVNFLFTAEKIIYKMFGMDEKETGTLLGSSKLAQQIVWADTTKKLIGSGIKVGKARLEVLKEMGKGNVKVEVSIGPKDEKEDKDKNKKKKGNDEDSENVNKEAPVINHDVNVKHEIEKTDVQVEVNEETKTEPEEEKKEQSEETPNLNLINRANLKMTKLGTDFKTKMYDTFGMNAPKELYEKQIKDKEKNLRLKEIHKKKKKQIKKSTRKRRVVKKATTILAGTGTFMVKMGTQELNMPAVFSSIESGRNVSKGIESAKKDKKPLAKNKKKSGAKTDEEQKDYEDTIQKHQRIGENKLKQSDKNSNKHQLKKEEAIKNMLVSTKMKQQLSGKNFDTKTKEGKENLEEYNKAFETINPSQTSKVLNKNVDETREKLAKYLKEKEGKTNQEIQLVLNQIQELVKQGVPLKTESESSEVKNYISSLVDMRYFVDKEQYESITEDFDGSFTNDIVEEYLDNIEKYKESEEKSKTEYDKESFDIDRYYDI